MSSVIYFAAVPTALPEVFPSPFAHAPHSIARRAAEELLAELRAGRLGVDVAALDRPGGGKMFGVLVVHDGAGRVGYLRAFSGMLDRRWELPSFVPPLFDQTARDAMWPAGQAALREHDLALRGLDEDPPNIAARASLAAFDAETAAALVAMRTRHRENRARRRDARVALPADGAERHALDQASRADAAERRRFDADRAAARAPLADTVHALDTRREAFEQARAAESRRLMHEVHDHYTITNARGERRPLRELFAPAEPAGGAGDCAGPKLLGHAYRAGLVPIALAEVWVGAPPLTGGRHAGGFYPCCRGKCGAILPFMLEGLAHEPAPVFGADAIPADAPRVVFEDDWIVVVDKPVGLLSVPGRSGALRDSVQTRLRTRYPAATGPLVVHRLDLETSGLLVAAKDEATHTALQAQFARKEIAKRYIAWLAGDVRGERGVIELALRVDLDDRPRQIHDPVHGKDAVTEWSVLARANGRTRVTLVPRTGRTHQLRLHVAHPLGLGTPIVGDRLYGRPDSDTDRPDGDARMLLHAEHLAFVHPRTGLRVEFEAPAAF